MDKCQTLSYKQTLDIEVNNHTCMRSALLANFIFWHLICEQAVCRQAATLLVCKGEKLYLLSILKLLLRLNVVVDI